MKNYLKKIYFHHHLLIQNSNFVWLVMFSSLCLVNYVNFSVHTSNVDLITNSAIKNNQNNHNKSYLNSNSMNSSFSLIYPDNNNNKVVSTTEQLLVPNQLSSKLATTTKKCPLCQRVNPIIPCIVHPCNHIYCYTCFYYGTFSL